MRDMRATPRHAPVHHGPLALPEHHFVQVWLLVAAFAVLALAVLHRRGLLELMFALDRSHVTQAVAALVLAGSAHALWHLLACSRRIERATALLHDARHVPADDGLVDAWHALGQPEDSVVDGGDLVDGDLVGRDRLIRRHRAVSPHTFGVLGDHLVGTGFDTEVEISMPTSCGSIPAESSAARPARPAACSKVTSSGHQRRASIPARPSRVPALTPVRS